MASRRWAAHQHLGGARRRSRLFRVFAAMSGAARQAQGPMASKAETPSCWRLKHAAAAAGTGAGVSSRSASSFASSIAATGELPTASKALTTVRSQATAAAGLIVPRRQRSPGCPCGPWRAWRRGMLFLSQPPIAKQPVMLWALQAVSRSNSADHLARHQQYFIPSVAHRDASLTVDVQNVCGMAPASRAATTARSVSRR